MLCKNNFSKSTISKYFLLHFSENQTKSLRSDFPLEKYLHKCVFKNKDNTQSSRQLLLLLIMYESQPGRSSSYGYESCPPYPFTNGTHDLKDPSSLSAIVPMQPRVVEPLSDLPVKRVCQTCHKQVVVALYELLYVDKCVYTKVYGTNVIMLNIKQFLSCSKKGLQANKKRILYRLSFLDV